MSKPAGHDLISRGHDLELLHPELPPLIAQHAILGDDSKVHIRDVDWWLHILHMCTFYDFFGLDEAVFTLKRFT